MKIVAQQKNGLLSNFHLHLGLREEKMLVYIVIWTGFEQIKSSMA